MCGAEEPQRREGRSRGCFRLRRAPSVMVGGFCVQELEGGRVVAAVIVIVMGGRLHLELSSVDLPSCAKK